MIFRKDVLWSKEKHNRHQPSTKINRLVILQREELEMGRKHIFSI